MANASIASVTPVPASADEAESWVRGELIRSLMRSARGSYMAVSYTHLTLPTNREV